MTKIKNNVGAFREFMANNSLFVMIDGKIELISYEIGNIFYTSSHKPVTFKELMWYDLLNEEFQEVTLIN